MITTEELAALVRIAGLDVAAERMPALLGELEGALAAAAELDDVVRATGIHGGEAFDASWGHGRSE
jgi:hypothetical protein